MEQLKDARAQAQENIFDWEQTSFISGALFDPPPNVLPDDALAVAQNVKIFPEWFEGRTGTKLWSSLPYPTNDTVYAREIYKKGRKIVILIGTRLYYTDIAMTSWTEIQKKTKDAPTATFSVLFEKGDYLFLWNANGLFKIDMEADAPCYWRANAVVPTHTMTEAAETGVKTYGRRYIQTMSILSGTGNRDRTTAGVVVKQESGPTQPDNTDEAKDYRENFTEAPLGAGTDTYQVLTCGLTGGTLAGFAAVSNAAFVVTANSYTATVYCDLTGVASFGDIAARIQNAARQAFLHAAPRFTCWCEAGYFKMHAGRFVGSTISVLSAPAAGTDISGASYLNGLAGTGSVANSTINSGSSMGPLTNPTGEVQWTHYTLYGTPDTGEAEELSPGNRQSNPYLNKYAWLADLPLVKVFMASKAANGTVTATVGTFERWDVNALLLWQSGTGFTSTAITGYTSGTTVTCAVGAITERPACIGSSRGPMTISQSGYQITRTGGAQFTVADEEQPIWHTDGSRSWITHYIDANNVLVDRNVSRTGEAAAIGVGTRRFNDVCSDDEIRNRLKTWPLNHRLWKELPSCNRGIAVPGYLFSANADEHLYYYSPLALGREYLGGYYNPALHYEELTDTIKAFATFPNMVGLMCSRSLKRVHTNIVNYYEIKSIGMKVPVLNPAVDTVTGVGLLDIGSLQPVEGGGYVMVTSEPAVRGFDGAQLSENYAIHRTGRSILMKILRSMAPEVSSGYDPLEGYLLWGSGYVLCFALTGNQGIGWSQYTGNYPIPETRLGMITTMDSSNRPISLIFDATDRKAYLLANHNGPTGSGITKEFRDKITSYAGYEIECVVRPKEHEQKKKHRTLEHQSSGIQVLAYEEANRGATGYTADGLRSTQELTVRAYLNGSTTAATTFRDLSLKGELPADVKLEAERVQFEYVFAASEFKVPRMFQSYLIKDKIPAPADQITSEQTYQLEFCDPVLWLSRGPNLALDRATAATLSGSYASEVTGPDQKTLSALQFGAATGLSAILGSITGDFTVILSLAGITDDTTLLEMATGAFRLSIVVAGGLYTLRYTDSSGSYNTLLSWTGTGWTTLKITRAGTALSVAENGAHRQAHTLADLVTVGGLTYVVRNNAAQLFDLRIYAATVSTAAFHYYWSDVTTNYGKRFLPMW